MWVMLTFFSHQIIPSWVIMRIGIKNEKQCYICLVNPLVSSTNQIYHLAAPLLGHKFDWSMTLGELLDNITPLFIFYFLNIRSCLSATVYLHVLCRCIEFKSKNMHVAAFESNYKPYFMSNGTWYSMY